VDRLERLVNLVAALIDAPRPLTRSELRERVGGYAEDDGAFRRNFERDKETLRQMGLPLETMPLPGDHLDDPVGYRILRERYELPDPGLSEEELAALRIAASAVGVEGGETAGALRKLAAPAADTGAGCLAELGGGEAVTTAFAAITERRRLRFAYRGERRVVDPWRLAYRSGHWYLSGMDHGRGAERLFRLDRLEGPLVPDGDPGEFAPATASRSAPPPPWQLGDDPPTEVVVAVDAEQAPWARQAPGATAVEGPGGAVELTLQVTNRAAFRSWLLGFLDHAEVLGPPDVRDEVVAWLEAAAGGTGAG
jgi:predicted DNA-binding transcriptional regulator YafY